MPVYKTGRTTLPPLTSGGPWRAAPCDDFLRIAYSHVRAHNPQLASPACSSTAPSQSPCPTAIPYDDQSLSTSTDTQRDLESRIAAAANDFINCPKCKNVSQTCQPRKTYCFLDYAAHNLTMSGYPDGNPNHSDGRLMSFEEYWCSFTSKTYSCFPSHCNGGIKCLFNLTDTAKSVCMSLEKENYTSWAVGSHTSQMSGPSIFWYQHWVSSLTQPCCNTWCSMLASEARLLYWPTPAPEPHISSYVDNG